MTGPKDKAQSGANPPSQRQHPLPRRVAADKSITLRHHRLARAASLRANASGRATSSPRRNSSGDSHETGQSGQSDPNTWFNDSNENPGNFDSHAMDVDPPFFQKETDSSNEEGSKPRPASFSMGAVAEGMRKSHIAPSTADDYRSVIDDLTVEIQRLKEELKRYKQVRPDELRKEKLFEIKMHGLPKRKKRELEEKLRDFATSLQQTPSAEASSSQRKKSSRRQHRDESGSGSHPHSNSKYQTSSSGSRSRPVDSAYASMSTDAHSSGTSMARPSVGSSRTRSSDLKVESYLKDIPEGLYPRHMVMTDKEKKKLVVRRLEHLFTGKIAGRGSKSTSSQSLPLASAPPQPVMAESQVGGPLMMHQPPSLTQATEHSREAKILPPELASNKKTRSRDNVSTSHSGGDRTESGGHGSAQASGTNPSPPSVPPHEQRPTRPRDLDPDRVQIPSENMEYIRHLGLVPPELIAAQEPTSSSSIPDVAPDAEGWVYLNLLCNLAQLHIINVAPDFIRAAVSERSTKLQLSPDGRKIRWRGGTENTKFSSDSSGDNSKSSPLTDDTEASGGKDGSGSGGKRKRPRATERSGEREPTSAHSSKKQQSQSQLARSTTRSFHYQPMFVRKSQSHGQVSPDDSESSYAPNDSDLGDSHWDLSGSGSSPHKRRRVDGAIIYYSGAPFCTDLSGDPGGDLSPATYMASTGQGHLPLSASGEVASTSALASLSQSGRPTVSRNPSGSSLPYRPLVDGWPRPASVTGAGAMDVDGGNPKMGAIGGDDDNTTNKTNVAEEDCLEFDTSWSDAKQLVQEHRLEPCGIGGVVPEDHFVVVVTSRRPKSRRGSSSPSSSSSPTFPAARQQRSEKIESVVAALAAMNTATEVRPIYVPSRGGYRGRLGDDDDDDDAVRRVAIKYLSGRVKFLEPLPLPPPALFVPGLLSESSSGEFGDIGSEAEGSEAAADDDFDDQDHEIINDSNEEELMSRRANPHQSDVEYPDNVDITSGDEEGGEPDDESPPVVTTTAADLKAMHVRRSTEDEEEEADEDEEMAGEDEEEESSDSETGGVGKPGSLRRTVRRASTRRSGATVGSSAAALPPTNSSVATAGDPGSGYSSSAEDK